MEHTTIASSPLDSFLRCFLIAAFVRTAFRRPVTFYALTLTARDLATGPELFEALERGVVAGLIKADATGRFMLASAHRRRSAWLLALSARLRLARGAFRPMGAAPRTGMVS